jgi:hypothetical protein
VSYYFAKKSVEYFDTEDSCLKCKVGFINERIRLANIWIPYLENCLKLLNSNIIEEFETSLHEKKNRIIKHIVSVEKYYTQIHATLMKVARHKNIKLPKIDLKRPPTEKCYVAKSCDDPKLASIIDDYINRLDQIDYYANKLQAQIDADRKHREEMIRNREETIKTLDKNVNASFTSVFGTQHTINFASYMNDPAMNKEISDNIKSGDVEKLKRYADDPEIQKAVKSMDRDQVLGNLSGRGAFDKSQSEIGRGLLSKNLDKRDPQNEELEDKDATEAREKMGDSLKETDLPSEFTEYVKPDEKTDDKKIEGFTPFIFVH